MLRNFEDIPFDLLAWSDDRFRTTFRHVPDRLAFSIGQIGVLNPLIVCEDLVPGRFIIVTGWLRFLAAKELGDNSVPCHVYRSVPPKIMLLCSLLDNLAHRTLNPVEQAIALKRLEEFYSGEEIIRHFVPLLDIKLKAGASADQLLAGAAELNALPESLRWKIVEGVLASDTARILAPLPPGHLMRLLALFAALHLPAAEQLEVARDFMELWSHWEITPTEIIIDEGWEWLSPEYENEAADLFQQFETTGTSLPNARSNTVVPGASICLLSDRFEGSSPFADFHDGRKFHPGALLKESDSGRRVEQVRQALKRRLGRNGASEVHQNGIGGGVEAAGGPPPLPQEVRIVKGRRQGGTRLEVRFSNSAHLRSLLNSVLDAEEKGALMTLISGQAGRGKVA